jgi:hypothetical protein
LWVIPIEKVNVDRCNDVSDLVNFDTTFSFSQILIKLSRNTSFKPESTPELAGISEKGLNSDHTVMDERAVIGEMAGRPKHLTLEKMCLSFKTGASTQ